AQIAWLAVGALPGPQERHLRAHLETCEECRRYLKDLSVLTEKLAAGEVRSDIATDEVFHQELVRRIKAAPSPAIWVSFAMFARRVFWNGLNRAGVFLEPLFSRLPILKQWALGAIAATILLFAGLSLFVRRPAIS